MIASDHPDHRPRRDQPRRADPRRRTGLTALAVGRGDGAAVRAVFLRALAVGIGLGALVIAALPLLLWLVFLGGLSARGLSLGALLPSRAARAVA